MNKTSYVELLECTVKNGFNGEDRKRLIARLRGNEVIYTDKRKSKNAEDLIDCTSLDNVSALTKSLESKDVTIRIIEDYEYEKPYKYSVIFEYEDLNTQLINGLINEGLVVLHSDTNYCHDIYDKVGRIIGDPTVKICDEKIYFKFSLIRTSNRSNEEDVNIKYTILAVFYTSQKVLEIRFDNIADKFKSDKNFYTKQVNSIVAWVKRFLGVNISDINFRNVVDNIVKNRSDEVKVSLQCMKLNNQGTAVLKVADNGEFVLPILGDLKNLIENNIDMFDKEECKGIYSLLMDFIKEIEAGCDLPKVVLCWLKKGNDFSVEITHDFHGNTYSLFQHYGRTQDLEGMEYVTQYVIANRAMDNGE